MRRKKLNFYHLRWKKSNFIKNFNFKNKENKEVWSTFKILSEEPPECLGAYVISMTSSASDILSVLYLQKEANIKNRLRVVPLFETLDDLINAKSIMASLFSLKWYRDLIKINKKSWLDIQTQAKMLEKFVQVGINIRLKKKLLKLQKI